MTPGPGQGRRGQAGQAGALPGEVGLIGITGLGGQPGQVRGHCQLVDAGYSGMDFAALIELQAKRSGLTLAEDIDPVDDGLSPAAAAGRPA